MHVVATGATLARTIPSAGSSPSRQGWSDRYDEFLEAVLSMGRQVRPSRSGGTMACLTW